MINFQTILSAFNEKGTLLKWLQKVCAALEKSVLESISVEQTGNTAVFIFNFADDTKLETPPVALPKGDPGTPGTPGAPGADGRSITEIDTGESYVAGDNTITPVGIIFNEGNPETFTVKAKNGTNGTNGADGRGIASIFTIGHRTEGNEEITTLEIAYDEGDPEEIEVHAQNGTNGTDGAPGADGRGITDIVAGESYVAGDNTITPVTVTFSEGNPETFSVQAKNGADGAGALYRHTIEGTYIDGVEGEECSARFDIISSQASPYLSLSQIPPCIVSIYLLRGGLQVGINIMINITPEESEISFYIDGNYISEGFANDDFVFLTDTVTNL